MRKLLTRAIMAFMTLALIVSGNVFAEEADTTRPAMTISAPSPEKIKEGATVTYTVGVEDNVGVTALSLRDTDITMKGFTATVTITKTAAFSRTITFSNIKSTDDTSARYFVIREGVAQDAAGNKSKQKNSPDFEIEKTVVEEKDETRPAMTISAANPSSIYAGEKVTYTVGVEDNVGVKSFNLTAADIAMKGFTADVTITGSGNSRTVTFTNVKGTVGGSKYFVVAEGVAKDAAGNVTKQKNSPYFTLEAKPVVEEKDETRPAMTISAANPSSIYAGEKVTYTVSVNDNVGVKSFNLTAADIAMKGFTADVTITGSGNSRTVTFTNVKGTVGGSKYFVVAEGVAKDAAGNVTKQKNSPAFAIKEKVVEADTTRPAMTISAANPSSIYVGEKVIYTVSVNDNVGVKSFNLTAADIKMVGFTADVTITGSGLTRTVTFTNVKGTVGGNKYFIVAEGVAQDAAGNVTKQKNSPAFTIKEKTVEKPTEKPTEKPVEKPTQKPVKDVTPNTGRNELTVAPVVAVVSTLALAGVVVAKKYTANNCK